MKRGIDVTITFRTEGGEEKSRTPINNICGSEAKRYITVLMLNVCHFMKFETNTICTAFSALMVVNFPFAPYFSGNYVKTVTQLACT
jgi:hypothetical protein